MDASNPTARALRCLEVLQANPGITADRLGDRIGVSARGARRYVSILRAAGVPIIAAPGPHGGYRVGRGVRLPPLTFSAAEALGLVMAVLDGHHDPNNADEPVASALGKILRALPAPVAAQAEAVRRSTAPAPDRGAVRPDPDTTTALVQACSGRRRTRLGYRSESGAERTSDVDPWAVIVRHGRWYLLGHSYARDAIQVYRVDRVWSVEVLTDVFEPPPGLDPVAVLEEHLAVGWEYDVEVRIDAPTDAVTSHLPGGLGRLEPLDAANTRLTGSTSNPTWYAEQLAVIPASYRIVRGPELQDAARLLGQRLLDAARRPPPDRCKDHSRAIPARMPH